MTRSYVEEDLRSRYPGPLYYGKDAFAGLDAMRAITDPSSEAPAAQDASGEDASRRRALVDPDAAPSRAPSVESDNTIFEPPFIGSRVVKGVPIDEVAAYLNETALFRNQWQFRPENGETDPEFKERVQFRAAPPARIRPQRGPAGSPTGLRLLPGQRRR